MTASQQMNIDWIAVDWGTSNLRAWAMTAGRVVDHASSADGMGKLVRGQFEDALIRLIEPWLGAGQVPVIACGMVGSRQGWYESPYRTTPCTPVQHGTLVQVPVKDARLQMMIAPGLKQMTPADVMRGEETQIAGVLASRPDFEGVICLPGTHSKWVHVSAGDVVSFQTFLTGEMFALLSEQSVLRHGMTDGGWQEDAFDRAIADMLSQPEKIAARLFTLRAEGLISGLGSAAARARLSGLLIGIELAAARPYWLGRAVVLVGAPDLSAHYARALASQGMTCEQMDATACTIAGLATARGILQRAAE